MLRVFEGRQIFTMTMTVTTSQSTVPEGTEGTKAEGNSGQWTLGRCFKICGSKAVHQIQHEGRFLCIKATIHRSSQKWKDAAHKSDFFVCQKHREWSREMHDIAQLQRCTAVKLKAAGHTQVATMNVLKFKGFLIATRCPFLQSQCLLL